MSFIINAHAFVAIVAATVGCSKHARIVGQFEGTQPNRVYFDLFMKTL